MTTALIFSWQMIISRWVSTLMVLGPQATVTNIFDTSGPSNLYFKCASGTGIIEYVIHNNNGNCLRMRDANNGYAVMEERGCTTTDLNERFVTHGPGTDGSKNTFQN